MLPTPQQTLHQQAPPHLSQEKTEIGTQSEALRAATSAGHVAEAALPVPRLALHGAHLPARKGKRSWVGRSVLVVALIGVAAGLFWAVWTLWLGGHGAPDVLTATATRGDLVITVADRGELESSERVQVMCEVEGGGKLVTIVTEGTRVRKGEEVARLDTDALLKAINEQEVKWEQADGKVKTSQSDLEVQKNKAESEIAKADIALVLAKIDYDSYEEGEYLVELDKRKGTLELGKKELKEAEDGLDFTRGLVKKGFAQMEQMRVMELTVEGKRYAVRQQEADLKVLTKFAKVRKLTELKAKADDARRELERTKKIQAAATAKAAGELRAAQKTAELEQRQLERLRRQLGKCVVKAPQDGIVIYSNPRPWDETYNVRAGATVNYQQTIFTLPDLQRMKVSLKIHESVVKKLQKGQSATMVLDALANQVLHGSVIAVGSVAQSNNWVSGGVKEYKVEVSIDDLPREAGLRPGMSADVKVHIKTVKDAVTVPVQAVTEFAGKQICFVVTPGGIERRTVRIGESNDNLVQILDGVSAGERVALDARLRAASELKTSADDKGPAKDTVDPKSSQTPVASN